MASTDLHIKQWNHNRQFLSTISPRYNDWLITAAFYTALHAVDTLLVSDKVPNIVSHATRNDALKNQRRYLKVFQHYRPLYELSQTVRYLAKPEDWVAPDKVMENVVTRYLYPTEQSVIKLASLGAMNLPPIVLQPA